MSWQKIGSAPKNTHILVYFKDKKIITIATYDNKNVWWDVGGVYPIIQPSHWTYLPDPPKEN